RAFRLPKLTSQVFLSLLWFGAQDFACVILLEPRASLPMHLRRSNTLYEHLNGPESAYTCRPDSLERREIILSWSLAAAVAIIGLIIGLRFRAPALLTFTLVIVIGSFVAAWMTDLTPSRVLTAGLLLLLVEHAAYFAGLAVSVALDRRGRS